MALFNVNDLRKSSRVSKLIAEDRLVKSAMQTTNPDIFLSHKMEDAVLIDALKNELSTLGFNAYVDWTDNDAPSRESITPETAEFLRKKIRTSKALFYIHSSLSKDSKWMPWEMGIKDGQSGKVAILPLSDNQTTSNSFMGSEYLGIYPYVTVDNDTKGKRRLWIHSAENSFITFEDWLGGKEPYIRN